MNALYCVTTSIRERMNERETNKTDTEAISDYLQYKVNYKGETAARAKGSGNRMLRLNYKTGGDMHMLLDASEVKVGKVRVRQRGLGRNAAGGLVVEHLLKATTFNMRQKQHPGQYFRREIQE
jgi:hypothetical protein